MYATYQVEKPIRHISQSTTLSGGCNYELKNSNSARVSRIPTRLMTYYVAGTFGLLTPTYINSSTATSNWEINHIEIQNQEKLVCDSKNATTQDIEYIRNILKISVTELGRVFGVTRQSVHEWIKGGALSLRNEERLQLLVAVAQIFENAGVSLTPSDLRRKIGNTPSVLEAIATNQQAINVAKQFVKTLQRERDQRALLAKRFAGRQSKLILDDLTPVHLEIN
jgi:DNA-binding transcriptional regulator YiaG